MQCGAKNCVSVAMLCSFLFIYPFGAIISALDEPLKGTTQITKKNTTTLIIPCQPTENISFIHWHSCLTYKEIHNWARVHGLKAHKSQFADEISHARFISKYGSKIVFENLDPFARYHLWIHFVTYTPLTSHEIAATLEIRAEKESIAHYRFQEILHTNEPVYIEIPYHLTLDGRLEIEFREHSLSGGFFGIWYMLLTDSAEYPRQISIQPKVAIMRETDSIIDKPEKTREKNIVQKKISHTSVEIDAPSSKRSTIRDQEVLKKNIAARAETFKGKKHSVTQKKAPNGVTSTEREKIEKQKEDAARKMLEEDRKKDIRAE
ncbi:MAG: hypothetical protein N2316_02895 [Spirochaetes bacterium]|nr:hypothetical protein [Spirochaetota bacterium]